MEHFLNKGSVCTSNIHLFKILIALFCNKVPQYSDEELDKMFYDEIKASKKGKGGYIFTSFVNTLTKYCRTDKPRPLMSHLIKLCI
jgi:hypothetical protein